VIAIWLPLWWAPVLLAWLWLGAGHVLVREGTFFGQTAVVTFGGAYAVLAYVAQRAVEDFRWLSPREMLDGLGMAETTPGPLIQVVQFVGFMGAWRSPGALPPWLAGTLAAVLTTWVTYVPCFLWIFLGAPYVERLRENRWLRAALSGITAAVVGVIANLAIWFSLHTLFGVVHERRFGPVTLHLPEWSSLDLAAAAIAIYALAAAFAFHVRLGWLLASCAALGLGWHLLGA
jgi:chromate transporter